MTNEFKGTEGTWYFKDGQVYPEETGKTLALLPYFNGEEKQIADGKLIAAAPDLLQALETICNYVEGMKKHIPYPAYKLIKAEAELAISKALD